VEGSEAAGEHDGHDEKACGDDQDLAGVMQAEDADIEDENPGDGQVEKAPENIDDGRGEAFARRLGEGRLEATARDAIDEMWEAVGQESAAEKIRNIVIPVHGWSVLVSKRNVTGFPPIPQKYKCRSFDSAEVRFAQDDISILI
jgi:hypothetical protein